MKIESMSSKYTLFYNKINIHITLNDFLIILNIIKFFSLWFEISLPISNTGTICQWDARTNTK